MKFRAVRAAMALLCSPAAWSGISHGFRESETAVQAYARLAQAGHADAQAALGSIYSTGIVVPRDDARAFFWLERAARRGRVESQAAVADMYREGRGVARDDQQAALWYARAETSSSYAAWRLGQMYESGRGVGVSYTRAVELYQRAANAGFAPAQNSLANLYLGGLGAPVDFGRALELYRAAAAQGYPDAELNLAGMYFQGLGVRRDYRIAYAWAQRALNHHARDARAFLNVIGEQLVARNGQ